MDGMALLCNLHAGGPATLQRLRGAGIHRLEEIAALREEELARLLDASPAFARRFAREALVLERRLGARERPAALADATPPRRWPEPRVELRPASRADLPPAGVPPPARRPQYGEPPAAIHPRAQPAAPPAMPREDGAPDALRPDLFEGLTGDLCERLARAGVRSVRELASCADLGLARRIGISYPRLLDLAHQARAGSGAALASRSIAPTSAAPDLRAATPSPVEEVGAGGPFV